MGVKVREWKGAWWLFVDHQGKRKARRVGVGKDGKKAADLAAIKIQSRLALGDAAFFDEGQHVPLFRDAAARWLAAHASLTRFVTAHTPSTPGRNACTRSRASATSPSRRSRAPTCATCL